MVVMNESEYLARQGVGSAFSGSSLDKCRFPHGLTKGQHDRIMKLASAQDDAYYEKRAKAREEYKLLVESGKVRPRTKEEDLIFKANGNPDNASTQAARRLCAKKGINWQVA